MFLYQLVTDQFCIVAILTQQFGVATLLHNTASINHQDQVSMAYGAQAVRNNDLGTRESGKVLLYTILGLYIQRAGCLVQQEDARLIGQRTR
jgi:hypothetical protein